MSGCTAAEETRALSEGSGETPPRLPQVDGMPLGLPPVDGSPEIRVAAAVVPAEGGPSESEAQTNAAAVITAVGAAAAPSISPDRTEPEQAAEEAEPLELLFTDSLDMGESTEQQVRPPRHVTCYSASALLVLSTCAPVYWWCAIFVVSY